MYRAITSFVSEIAIPAFVSVYYVVSDIKELMALSGGDLALSPGDAGIFFLHGFLILIIIPVVCVYNGLIFFEVMEKPDVGTAMWQIKFFGNTASWVLFIILVIKNLN
ncbi:MAG: hypothetical protein WAZ40_03235 [Minisyncoccia bacterium]